MPKNKKSVSAQSKIIDKSTHWCHNIVMASYGAIAVNTLGHMLWFIIARNALIVEPELYWRDYILLTNLSMLAVNVVADVLIRSDRVTSIVKEYSALIAVALLCFCLSFSHVYATVLLGSYLIAVLVSTIFANIKITRHIYLLSCALLLVSGVNLYFTNPSGYQVTMEWCVAWCMLFCSYLVAGVLIRYGQDNIQTLMYSYNSQKSMQEQLKLDPFTGLYNRKTFDECLPQWMEECQQSQQSLCLAMLDLDFFKRVNDDFGHATGDQVLLRLTHILKSNQAENIAAFRVGGEEFALLLKGYCVMDAYKVCEGMRSIMQSSLIPEIGKRRVTFSCGLACMNEETAVSPQAFMRAADTALYSAKGNGRNRTEIFTETLAVFGVE